MVGKKLSVKADLAIYSQAVNVCGRCMSESLILGHNLDFSSCDIMVSFHKSSHILDNSIDGAVNITRLSIGMEGARVVLGSYEIVSLTTCYEVTISLANITNKSCGNFHAAG